jgi:hypothetical protein
MKRYYGMSERQFHLFFVRAERQKGVTGETLLQMLERRLDNVLFLAGILVFLVFRAATDWRRSIEDIAFIATGIPFYFFWMRKRKKNKSSLPP